MAGRAKQAQDAANDKQAAPNKARRVMVSQTDFPNHTLEQSIRIAQAIWDNFAGKGAAPHDIAIAMDMSPTSGSWRNLCGASIAYGLTEGGYNAGQISLSDLGRRIVAPIEEGDDRLAKVTAVLSPKIEKDFFSKYDKAKFPKDEIGVNVLVSLGLPKERAAQAFAILKDNGSFAGIIRDTKSGPFVALDLPPARDGSITPPASQEVEVPTESVDRVEEAADERAGSVVRDAGPAKQKQLVVAHGKNRKPLEDLKKILNEFKIPYKVAIDEANKGRPISGKVAELMNECSAGIFIFTKDEKFFKEKESENYEEVWRPSENVVYELGAANILWERKIIIVREDGVNFPSDFSDLGYITFKDGEIAAKALEIMKELIALELVRLTAA